MQPSFEDAVLNRARGVFDQLAASTPCPWARESRALVLSVNQHAEDVTELAASLLDVAQDSTPDMVVAVISHDHEPTVNDLAQILNKLLRGIAANVGKGCAFDDVERREWDFSPHEHAFFVVVLSSCYESSHPRAIPIENTTVVLFQTEASFRRRGMSSASKGRAALSDSVARRFAAAGRPYSAEELRLASKSRRYILPANLEESRIAWWRSEQA